jgi:hypothetical protein
VFFKPSLLIFAARFATQLATPRFSKLSLTAQAPWAIEGLGAPPAARRTRWSLATEVVWRFVPQQWWGA